MVEYECTLECNYNCPYCFNGRNKVLDKPINETEDLDKIASILNDDDEYYVYGGEPMMAKNIDFIVKTLRDNKRRYVLQTNFSLYDVAERLINIDSNIKFQISVHRTQIRDMDKHIEMLNKFKDHIVQCDVMFVDYRDLKLYRILQSKVDIRNLRLIPVADFATDKVMFRKSLYLYNKIQDLNPGNIIFDYGVRAKTWEKQMRGQLSLKGKRCIYMGCYVTYDPALNEHHCPQRYDGEICPFDTCFNIDKPIDVGLQMRSDELGGTHDRSEFKEYFKGTGLEHYDVTRSVKSKY